MCSTDLRHAENIFKYNILYISLIIFQYYIYRYNINNFEKYSNVFSVRFEIRATQTKSSVANVGQREYKTWGL